MTLTLRVFTEPQEGASYEDLLAVARTAEEHGFDAFFRSDHYQAIGGEGLPGSTDAWATLAGLARDTSRIRLGTLVSPVTFRLAGALAITVATVDRMSGGRVELGLGTGWYEDEHRAYGIPFPPVAERMARLEEQLSIVTGLWATAEGDTFDFEGRHHRLVRSPALPKPHQRPGPPIVVGGWGVRRTPMLAARFANEFNAPFAPLEEFRTAMGRVGAACVEVGRDPATLVRSVALTVACGRDEREVERRAAATGQSLEHLRRQQLAGTVDEVVDRLHAYRDAGADRVYLQVLDLHDLDHVRLLGDEVAPRV